jgi:hypothetical protein
VCSVIVRRSIAWVIALGVLLVPSPAVVALPPRAQVHVTPSRGGPDTTFVLSFVASTTTGTIGSMRVRDVLSASHRRSSARCLTSIDVPIRDHRKGQRLRVRLNPGKLGGRWCAGTYRGKIEELQHPVCPPREPCPAYVLVRGTIARFELRVRDVTPPHFAGLERAFACTPGPQRPGQTTPYTLAWKAATDDVTPSAQIGYDIYYSSTSGSEDYSKPTWTTPPGATSFRTPGLPSHASAFFVVRAIDAAGNEDANTVERAGVDPCV